MRPLWRSRWAVVGSMVAICAGAGGFGIASASLESNPDHRWAEVPAEEPAPMIDDAVVKVLPKPCRIRDTRPDKGVGGRLTPLGPAEEYTVQGTGASGDCKVSADAVGLVLNVTADQATEKTNLRLYPTGADIPTTSNLNPRPGAAPTPNSVIVGLDASGEFDIRNAKGQVHVIIDVSAYLVEPTVPSPVVVPAAAFHPDGDASSYFFSFTDLTYRGIGTDCHMAPVALPVGATIDRVRFFVKDTNASAGMDVSLSRHELGGSGSQSLATASTSPTFFAGQQTITIDAVDYAAVSGDHTYALTTCLQTGLAIDGVQIFLS